MLAIFIDIESTGLDPKVHSVIDIALKLVNFTTNSIESSYQSTVDISLSEWEARDPESIKINGYTQQMLSFGKKREKVTCDIIEFFKKNEIVRKKAVFICQNPAFDRIFFAQLVNFHLQEQLFWPYHWLDLASMYWAFSYKKYLDENITFPETFSVSKNEIAEKYGLPSETQPHRAINGVDHLIKCYEAIFNVEFKCVKNT